MEDLLIKKALYEGVCIYNEILNCKIKLDNILLNNINKKYLALYLGLISVIDTMGIKIHPLNISVNYIKLNKDFFIRVYEDEFNSITFNSIEEYMNFLLSKDIIKEFNKINNIFLEKLINENHKKLVKE